MSVCAVVFSCRMLNLNVISAEEEMMIHFPERLIFLFQAFLISLLMTVFVSGVSTFVSVGTINELWFDLWFGVCGLSWLISFPALFLILLFVRKTSVGCGCSCESQNKRV